MKMTHMRKIGRVAGFLCVAALLAACGPAATAQSPGTADPGPLVSQFVAAGVSVPNQLADLVVREIDDPHSGARWLLMRDHNHPAGPGRLILVATANRQAGQGEPVGSLSPVKTEMIRIRPIIRAGDRLVVEENTALIEARLEAVALGPATLGSTFDVRLKMGGKVARAIALAPGRAAFHAQMEARP